MRTMMPKHGRLVFLAAVGVALVLVSGCSGDSEDRGPVLATINDYDLHLKEFERQLSTELEYSQDVKLTRRVRERFLDGLIRKELLIQEAMRRGLEREKPFVRSIERYWESTLIRNLLEMKSTEIIARILVSEEEVQARYDRMKAEDGALPPLETFRDQIYAMVREEKKSKMLDQWVGELKEQTEININRELLHGK